MSIRIHNVCILDICRTIVLQSSCTSLSCTVYNRTELGKTVLKLLGSYCDAISALHSSVRVSIAHFRSSAQRKSLMHRSIATCSGHHFTHSTTPKFVQLLPSEIRYIRLSTSQRLSSGLHVTDLLKRCLCGNMDIEELTHKNLEVMTVMKYGGYYWVTDGTKRLWVLKEMEKLSLCGKISVRVVTRRVHSLWDRLASTASNGQEIEFCCASDAERFGFEEKARNIIKEFERNGGRPFDLRPASSRFLWAAHPTTAQIMSKRIEDHLRNSGHYQWFRGPYNVERRFILGFFFLFFLISLSVLGKTLGDLEEAEGASK